MKCCVKSKWSFSSHILSGGLLISMAACHACGQQTSTWRERTARAREQRNEAEIERLVIECETRLNDGDIESRPELLEALVRLTQAAGSWEWDNFQKQQQIPKRIALFVLEKHQGHSSLEVEIGFACMLSDPPHPRDPNLAKLLAERRHRLSLVTPVLHRLLRSIDPSVDLSDVTTFAHIEPPIGTSQPFGPKIRLEEIEDPALRADFERRFRERELKEQRKGEQSRLLLKKNMFLPLLENYIVAAYTLGPPDMQELHDVLKMLRGDQQNAELESLAARILNRVQTAVAATQPP